MKEKTSLDKIEQIKRDFIVEGNELLSTQILELLVLHQAKISKDGETIIIGEYNNLNGEKNRKFVKDLVYKMFCFIEGIKKVYFEYSELLELRKLSDKIIKQYERKRKLK